MYEVYTYLYVQSISFIYFIFISNAFLNSYVTFLNNFLLNLSSKKGGISVKPFNNFPMFNFALSYII